MRSAAGVAERVARALALGLVVIAAWGAFAPRSRATETVRVEGELRQALVPLSHSPAGALELTLDRVPGVVERDWLVALRRAGTAIAWKDAGLPSPMAIAITRAADPAGVVTVSIAATDAGSVVLRDAIGAVDSIAIAPPGARVTASAVQGSVRIDRDGVALASTSVPAELVLRPLLVLGSAGWEAKFVIAALEERGWTVHSRITVSPTATVSHGAAMPLDTANYAAIVLLDSVATASTSGVLRYLRTGGGVILAAGAWRGSALGAVAPARSAVAIAGSLLRPVSSTGRDGLPLAALTSLRGDAVALDERDGHVSVAVRREGAGRVATVGETESWRWRMSGGDGSPDAHRRFWANVIAAVAYAPSLSASPAAPEAAPYAALIDALGEPTAGATAASGPGRRTLPWWLGGGILALLLAEWVSRRLRGER